jgi:ABC-type amino acid transport substrate-binding protein
MHMNRRIVIAALAAAALAVPAAAGAQPGNGKGHEKTAAKVKKAKKVTFVFRGTFTAPGTIEVLAGNAHVRKGGFVGEAVTFDFASAKVVVADTNADQKLDVTDVKDGDQVLVQARIAKGTEYAAGGEAVIARKLVDKTNPPVEAEEAGS